mmetsp:Transcript_41601/g.97632  ORF Transcript_41601/g.97632 Transcript_41601/m.97632 type:complete len:201 (-) Transcript_41601:1439-2041(-)
MRPGAGGGDLGPEDQRHAQHRAGRRRQEAPAHRLAPQQPGHRGIHEHQQAEQHGHQAAGHIALRLVDGPVIARVLHDAGAQHVGMGFARQPQRQTAPTGQAGQHQRRDRKAPAHRGQRRHRAVELVEDDVPGGGPDQHRGQKQQPGREASAGLVFRHQAARLKLASSRPAATNSEPNTRLSTRMWCSLLSAASTRAASAV